MRTCYLTPNRDTRLPQVEWREDRLRLHDVGVFAGRHLKRDELEDRLTCTTEDRLTCMTEDKLTCTTEDKLTHTTEDKLTHTTEDRLTCMTEDKLT